MRREDWHKRPPGRESSADFARRRLLRGTVRGGQPSRERIGAQSPSSERSTIRYHRRPMMPKKPSLGRGLDALMGTVASRAPLGGEGTAGTQTGEELARLPLDRLQRGRYQPRIDMRPESLQELADS